MLSPLLNSARLLRAVCIALVPLGLMSCGGGGGGGDPDDAVSTTQDFGAGEPLMICSDIDHGFHLMRLTP